MGCEELNFINCIDFILTSSKGVTTDHADFACESLIYYTLYRSPMNTKIFLLAITIVAAATFVTTAIASIDVLNAIELTEAFAQNMTAGNMTNMTAGNMTNMTG